jgi:hypothetical protein
MTDLWYEYDLDVHRAIATWAYPAKMIIFNDYLTSEWIRDVRGMVWC